jgi:hypothetical protein
MGAQSYSLRREHNRWIVCAAGTELMACADKRMALRIIKAAAALGDQAGPIPRRHLIFAATGSDPAAGVLRPRQIGIEREGAIDGGHTVK